MRQAAASFPGAPKVMCSCHAALYNAPAEHHGRAELANGKSDETVRNQRLEDKLGEIHNRAEPRVLCTHEIGVVDQAEDRSVRQRGFVQRLQAVDNEHDGQQAPVNLAQDPSVIFIRDDDGVVCLLEDLSGSVFTFEGLAIVA